MKLELHQIISKKLGKICPPPLKYEPEFHDIGDEVIVLKTLEVGYVLGIDDNFVLVKLATSGEPQKFGFIEIWNRRWGMYLAK